MKNKFSLLRALVLTGFGLCLAAELWLRFFPPVWLPIETIRSVQQTHSELSENPAIAYLPKRNLSKPFQGREFSTQVRINSQSMRDREYPLQKPDGLMRVATFGDSFIFGWGVEDHEVVTEILETKYLKNTEVLNFAVSGYCGRQMLERLKSEFERFRPDIILFFTGGFPQDCRPQVKIANDLLYNSDYPLDFTNRLKAFLRSHSYLWAFISSSRRMSLISVPEPERRTEEEERTEGVSLLREFIDFCAQNNVRPVLIYFDDREVTLAGDDGEPSSSRSVLKRWSEEARVAFLDLAWELRRDYLETGISPYFTYDIHWNRHGHAAAAKALALFFETEGLLKKENFIPKQAR